MSIGTSHVFTPLKKDSKALAADQRLVRLIAKGKNKSENLNESLCVSVPQVTIEQVTEYIDVLMPYVVGMVADTQDKIIREYRIESGAADINEALFDVTHCVAWLSENATGERLTGEMLRDWLDEDYKDAIIDWAKQLPAMVNAPESKVLSVYNIVRDTITQYANPHFKPNMRQCDMILSLCGAVDNDGRMLGIAAKTQKFKDLLLSEADQLDFMVA